MDDLEVGHVQAETAQVPSLQLFVAQRIGDVDVLVSRRKHLQSLCGLLVQRSVVRIDGPIPGGWLPIVSD